MSGVGLNLKPWVSWSQIISRTMYCREKLNPDNEQSGGNKSETLRILNYSHIITQE